MLAQIPSARQATATIVKPTLLFSLRKPYRTSRGTLIIGSSNRAVAELETVLLVGEFRQRLASLHGHENWILERSRFFFLALPALAGQESPIQWPVPPPGPRRESRRPATRPDRVPELAAALAGGRRPPRRRGSGRSRVPRRRPRPASARGSPGWGSPAGRRSWSMGRSADREAVARAYWLLRRAGCAEVRVLDGGLAAWRAAGLPRDRPAPRPAAGVPPRPARRGGRGGRRLDRRTFAQAGVQLLDVRDARGWERWETPPTFAAGHIPYSLPFDPRALLPADGGWPDPAAVRRRLAAFGPRPGDPVRLESTFVLYGEDAQRSPARPRLSAPQPRRPRRPRLSGGLEGMEGGGRAAGGQGGLGRGAGRPACGGRTPGSPRTARRATSSCSTCASRGTSRSATCRGPSASPSSTSPTTSRSGGGGVARRRPRHDAAGALLLWDRLRAQPQGGGPGGEPRLPRRALVPRRRRGVAAGRLPAPRLALPTPAPSARERVSPAGGDGRP